MKKIWLGLLTIFLVGGLLVGGAYALFADRIEIEGLLLNTGNADLVVSSDGGQTWQDGVGAPALQVVAYPGWQAGQLFALKNQSQSPIDLRIQSGIDQYQGDWEDLASVVEVKIIAYQDLTQAQMALAAQNPEAGIIKQQSDWLSLADWYAEKRTVDDRLELSQDRYYVIWGRIDRSYGNEVANKQLGVDWLIEAEQI